MTRLFLTGFAGTGVDGRKEAQKARRVGMRGWGFLRLMSRERQSVKSGDFSYSKFVLRPSAFLCGHPIPVRGANR